jgi:hypothetical protein
LIVIGIHTIYLVYLKNIDGTHMQIQRRVHLSRKTYYQLMLDERSHHETTVVQEERQVSISVIMQGKDCTQSIGNADGKDKGENI